MTEGKREISQMHGDSRLSQGKEKRQPGEYIEAAAGSHNENVLALFQLLEKGRFQHLITSTGKTSIPDCHCGLPKTEWVPAKT